MTTSIILNNFIKKEKDKLEFGKEVYYYKNRIVNKGKLS